MKSDQLYIVVVPAFFAVLVHLLFGLAMEGGWTSTSPVMTAQPQVIQASLVSLTKPIKRQAQPKPKPKPKPEPIAAPKPQPAPNPEPIVSSEPPAERQEPSDPEPSDPEPSREVRLAELQKELMAGLDELPDAEGGDGSEIDEVQQVASLMQARIAQNWRRPPSARNGMEALLIISLVPTGEVVGISISQGSGSNAFDQSAIAAVERVGQFPEVTVLPISDFEQYFRRFPLRFKPEDLRY
ncbi:MAG: TonB family protein [Proteobacteria bacterium]|nr:TonB family protein [Pseudomonadota bacterium]